MYRALTVFLTVLDVGSLLVDEARAKREAAAFFRSVHCTSPGMGANNPARMVLPVRRRCLAELLRFFAFAATPTPSISLFFWRVSLKNGGRDQAAHCPRG